MDAQSSNIQLNKLSPAERKRTYVFPGGNKISYENVVAFLARPSGSHRLELADGTKVVVPAGFLAVELDVDSWTL